MKIDYAKYTGKGILIAVIDSGIEKDHPSVSNIVEGFSLFSDDVKDAFIDNVGHGTACAGIINSLASEARIMPVKALNANLEGDVEKISEAILRLAKIKEVDIINLSLGSTSQHVSEALEKACNEAYSNNKLVVAAASKDGEISYPAAYSSVLGVGTTNLRKKFDYKYAPKQFPGLFARGDKQKVAWKDGTHAYMGGSSFAAPRIVSMLALIREAYPESPNQEVIKILINNATEKVDNISTLKVLSSKVENGQVPTFMNSCEWIRKAHLYPFNKEMNSLIRYYDLVNFEIVGVTDFLGGLINGKTVAERTGLNSLNLKIGHKLEKDLDKADTLILGHLETVSMKNQIDLTVKALEIALSKGKNVFSLSPLFSKKREELVKKAEECGLKFVSPQLGEKELAPVAPYFFGASLEETLEAEKNADDFRPFIDNWVKEYSKENTLKDIQAPIVNVFGTGPQQGKFSIQLLLRKHFLKDNFNVLQIGTEPQSQLFNFDFTYPMGFESGIRMYPFWNSALINHLLFKFNEIKEPDVVIAGTQSGIVPFDLTRAVNVGFPNISFMIGLKPDVCILTVNPFDPINFIKDNIDVIRIFGKCKTICIVISPLQKTQSVKYSRVVTHINRLEADQTTELKEKFSKELNLPCFALADDNDHAKIYSCVIDYLRN